MSKLKTSQNSMLSEDLSTFMQWLIDKRSEAKGGENVVVDEWFKFFMRLGPIFEAAPDLLDICQRWVEHFKSDVHPEEEEAINERNQLLLDTQVAIKKATE